jgi:hypothetical protein
MLNNRFSPSDFLRDQQDRVIPGHTADDTWQPAVINRRSQELRGTRRRANNDEVG